MKHLLYILIAIGTLSGCAKKYYLASDFKSKTNQHQQIAVLPVEMIYTGKQPKNITEEQIKEIEKTESKMFMISVHDAILESTKNGKKPMRINVQSFTTTLNILEDNNISVQQAWRKSPGMLADLLGVDAVVQSRIHKERYMSDLASYGIDVGIQAINVLTDGALWGVTPHNLSTTNTIKSNFTLINSADGSVLYSQAFTNDADWNSPPRVIVDRITKKFGKHFPYRVGKN